MASHTMVSQGITFYSREINVMDLVTDEDSLQPREGYNAQVREELRVKFLAGLVAGIPGAFVFYIGGKFYVVDGFHRVSAAMLAGVLMIQVWVTRGTYTMDDAKIFAAGANTHPQTKMTPGDKKKAAFMLFGINGVRGNWSEKRMAAHVGAGDMSVKKWHIEWCEANGEVRKLTQRGEIGGARKLQDRIKMAPDFSDVRTYKKKDLRSGKVYRLSWKGTDFYLGTTEDAARAKFKELADSGAFPVGDTVRRLVSVAHSGQFYSWLQNRISLPIIPRSAFGRGSFCEFRVGNPGSLSIVRLAPEVAQRGGLELRQRTIPHFVGDALMDKAATGAARAVVLCYLPDDCRELAATALKLGVEFLSPDEFVESIVGAPVEVDA